MWKSVMIKMDTHLLFVSLLLTSIALVAAQDQSGFIMIDCGISENTSYTDPTTGILYVSDTKYINTGVNAKVAPFYTYSQQQYNNLRAFPEGIRNCYTIQPPYVKNKTRYFIRAGFNYGNYDGENKGPAFDIYLGVNFWARVSSTYRTTIEILHTPTLNFTYVCLVNTGHGTPFISALELRLVDDNIYNATTSGSMRLVSRYDVGKSIYSSSHQRYKDDAYDRLWDPPFLMYSDSSVNTTSSVDQNSYKLPSIVMNTADTSKYPNVLSFFYSPVDASTVCHIFFHFVDFQLTSTREFGIYFDDLPLQLNVRPNYLSATTVYSMLPQSSDIFINVSLVSTARSTLPPILNAYEIYSMIDLQNMFTDTGDVYAIREFKATYGLERNWQGDPCSPRTQLWEGIDCFNATSVDAPRIVSLRLSFSGLTGVISSSIFNLTMLQRLDLSYNNLTGELPIFLTQMPKLNVLILSGNNFTGTIPAKLLERSQNGSLLLSLDQNPYLLCKEKSCEIKSTDKEPHNKFGISGVIAIIVGAAFLVLLVAFGILWRKLQQKQRQLAQTQPPHHQQQQPQTQPPQQQQQRQPQTQPPQQQQQPQVVPVESIGRRTAMLKSKDRHFSYSEVMRITGNFQNELGGGGFGKVYHGYLDEKEVAVKMLSLSSAQGYKQFKAEAKLLMRVHHKNLTTLVGYCDEGDNLGLIYEFMANGDLRSQLSERNPNFLSWETRIEIALDAAQGLEYLHSGCTPPIIHRDVKSTNILLDDKFQAKLGDFGLSKVFPTEDQGSTLVSTTFAGTPGYLDPEFKMNEKSDVFSFGVVLLELITGQPAISRSQTRTHLSNWARDVIAEGDVRNVVDPRLGKDFDVNSKWKAVDLALVCVSATSSARPTMNIVVMELKTCSVMEKTRVGTCFRSNASNNGSSEMSSLNIETTRFTSYGR